MKSRGIFIRYTTTPKKKGARAVYLLEKIRQAAAVIDIAALILSKGESIIVERFRAGVVEQVTVYGETSNKASGRRIIILLKD